MTKWNETMVEMTFFARHTLQANYLWAWSKAVCGKTDETLPQAWSEKSFKPVSGLVTLPHHT